MHKKSLTGVLLLASGLIAQTAAFTVYTGWPFDSTEAKRRQQETAADLQLPAELAIDLGSGVPLIFELIPAGTSRLGSPASEPGHEGDEQLCDVTFQSPFYMTKYQLTREQYFAAGLGCSWFYTGEPEPPVGGDKYPVLLRYTEADSLAIPTLQAFMPAGMQLSICTKDQFEHACRAGTEATWYAGGTEADMARIGWYRSNSANAVHPVGQKGANPWGLCDMVGNAWTWVYTETPRLQLDEYCYLVKGGSYYSEAFGNGCRTANLMIQSSYVGLRLAATLPSGPVSTVPRGAQPSIARGELNAAHLSVLPQMYPSGPAFSITGRKLAPANAQPHIPVLMLPRHTSPGNP